jgi:hypothetical protein
MNTIQESSVSQRTSRLEKESSKDFRLGYIALFITALSTIVMIFAFKDEYIIHKELIAASMIILIVSLLKMMERPVVRS